MRQNDYFVTITGDFLFGTDELAPLETDLQWPIYGMIFYQK